MTTAKDVLVQAREIIARPEHWTQGASYRDQDGHNTTRETAVSFCLGGAIDHATYCLCSDFDVAYTLNQRAIRLIDDVCQGEPGDFESCVKYNDHPGREHREVLAVLDKAIASA